jgi:FAD-dependent monooxygenase
MDLPVLVAGGGPVGLIAAYTLAHHGIRCMLVERNESTTKWPKMDITNVRSMEILRRLGLADELREQGISRSRSAIVPALTFTYRRWTGVFI